MSPGPGTHRNGPESRGESGERRTSTGTHAEGAHVADLPPSPEVRFDDYAEAGPDGHRTERAPLWVFAIAIVVGLLIVALHLTGILGPGLH